jgi:hypothetical protein
MKRDPRLGPEAVGQRDERIIAPTVNVAADDNYERRVRRNRARRSAKEPLEHEPLIRPPRDLRHFVFSRPGRLAIVLPTKIP